MKRPIILWQFFGFIATALGGTLLHFLYDWLGEAVWIAPFAGVNESTFEHMKLLFWPMFIFAIVQSFFFKGRDDFWCVKLRGILLGIFLIPAIFYLYNGVIGKSPDWLNISIFFISALSVYIYEARLFFAKKLSCEAQILPVALLCIAALFFTIFTFFTPELEIFRDPLTGIYGT